MRPSLNTEIERGTETNPFSSPFFVFLVFFIFFLPGQICIADDLPSAERSELSAELRDPRSGTKPSGSRPEVNTEETVSENPAVPDFEESPETGEPVPVAETGSAGQEKTANPLISVLQTVKADPNALIPTGKKFISGGNLPILLALLTVVPAVLITTTCYVRVITVLALLRHALGIPQIPSTQILAAISLFLTLLVMSPTWTRVWREAWVPYVHEEISAEEAFHRGEAPIRTFLWKQIERTRNTENVRLFMKYIPDTPEPKYYEDIPWRALLPAYMLSELKTAFMIGFQLFLPFIIIDLVVSGVMVSMGMMMLPPTVVSLPFKLMLFVLLDAWDPVVRMLIESFTLT